MGKVERGPESALQDGRFLPPFHRNIDTQWFRNRSKRRRYLHILSSSCRAARPSGGSPQLSSDWASPLCKGPSQLSRIGPCAVDFSCRGDSVGVVKYHLALKTAAVLHQYDQKRSWWHLWRLTCPQSMGRMPKRTSKPQKARHVLQQQPRAEALAVRLSSNNYT